MWDKEIHCLIYWTLSAIISTEKIIWKDVSVSIYNFFQKCAYVENWDDMMLYFYLRHHSHYSLQVKWQLSAQFYSVAFLVLKLSSKHYFCICSLPACPWPLVGYLFAVSLPAVKFCSYFSPCIWSFTSAFLFWDRLWLSSVPSHEDAAWPATLPCPWPCLRWKQSCAAERDAPAQPLYNETEQAEWKRI